MAKYFFQKFVIFITIPDSLLIEKCGTLEVTKEVRLQKRIKFKLSGQYSVRFGIFQVA